MATEGFVETLGTQLGPRENLGGSWRRWSGFWKREY